MDEGGAAIPPRPAPLYREPMWMTVDDSRADSHPPPTTSWGEQLPQRRWWQLLRMMAAATRPMKPERLMFCIPWLTTRPPRQQLRRAAAAAPLALAAPLPPGRRTRRGLDEAGAAISPRPALCCIRNPCLGDRKWQCGMAASGGLWVSGVTTPLSFRRGHAAALAPPRARAGPRALAVGGDVISMRPCIVH